ncbi:MAG: metallophosphoesterase [Bacteroidetes bacterium]|nr:MAG: metallophosphoesterase [Bacteroidota bacterium]
MQKIGLLSDTHSYFHPELPRIFKDCDEIWHAGDFGDWKIIEKLKSIKPLRGVYGNIDSTDIRTDFPELLRFRCEEVDVLMTHIGGYPGNYAPAIRPIMKTNPPKLFISGHSHILKIIFDKKHNCLHLNPGAAGRYGFHKVISLLRFTIDGPNIKDMEVVELPRESKS